MSNWRPNVFLFLFFLLAAIIIVRLFYIQVLNKKYYSAIALGQQTGFQEVQGNRGEIFFENSKETKKLQKKLFEAQIDLALEVGKPLMLHIRPSDKISYDAYFDSLEILESYNKIHGSKLKGNAHFYVGNTEILKRFLDISFTASFSGVVTFTHEYDEAVKFVPLNMIMSETDAPFVAPVPFRGKRNEPAYVVEVVKKLAEIRTENMYVLNDSIVENFKRVFGV